MTWSPLFNPRSSYKDAVYWTTLIRCYCTCSNNWNWRFLNLHSSSSHDNWPMSMHSLLRVYWHFHMDREVIKHTGNHETEQHSGSVHLPILGSPLTPLWDKTNQETKAKQKTSSKSNPFKENSRVAFNKIRQQLWKKWRHKNRRKNPGKNQIWLTSSKKS